MSRPASSKAQLLRLGFADPGRALGALQRLGPHAESLMAVLGAAADPDLALDGLTRLADAFGSPHETAALLSQLAADEGTASRLAQVLGASEALADHLVRHPHQWRELADPTIGSTRTPAYSLRERLLTAVGADPGQAAPRAARPDREAGAALRVEYRRALLRIAARDLAHGAGVDDVAAELSDLAAATLEAALAVARAGVGDAADRARLAVVALGKCGGHELNYVSDVDVVFVYAPGDGVPAEDEPAVAQVATRLAASVMQICSEHTADGSIWEVDAALRPEGRAGPLVRTVASHRGYYERWAKTWEFQALLKARPVAGDPDLGREYVAAVEPLVWTAAERPDFVEDVQAMRRRVLAHIPAREAERQLKLGAGGLRDVEFAVQLLQLVHGRADESIRGPATLSALAALTRGGYVGRDDGEALSEAYGFLRRLEHRIQLHRLHRSQVVPTDERALRRLGRAMGLSKEPVDALERAWQHHRLEVRRLHEKLFYRPLLSAVARIPGEDARLSSQAARERLAALGYADPDAALRHLEALTTGVSRSATVQRALLPVMLQWFADGADPDAGLFGFRRISEALGRTPWYLKTLRDEGQVAERLANLLSTSRYATALLETEPRGVQMLGEELRPQPAAPLTEEMLASAVRHEDAEDAVRAIRGIRRRELLRIAAGEVLGLVDVADVGRGLSRLTDATLEATLDAAGRAVRRQRSLTEAPTRIAVVAMGRYGGFELSYGSDADVLFVHDPAAGADPQAATSYASAVVGELRRLLAAPGADPPLQVDADLRPEGRQGPLVRTLESYAAYYARWSKVWEAQALLRADAVVGDVGLRHRFVELIDPLRFPEDGLSQDDVVEVRRIKARIDRERVPGGDRSAPHLKLGPGGLADVEWTVQLLQMRHAGRVPALRTAQTLAALESAAAEGLLSEADARALADGWRFVSRLRSAVTLARGRPGDQLPKDARERKAVARILGYPPGSSDELVNDFLRATRLARAAVDRVFWEDGAPAGKSP